MMQRDLHYLQININCQSKYLGLLKSSVVAAGSHHKTPSKSESWNHESETGWLCLSASLLLGHCRELDQDIAKLSGLLNADLSLSHEREHKHKLLHCVCSASTFLNQVLEVDGILTGIGGHAQRKREKGLDIARTD